LNLMNFEKSFKIELCFLFSETFQRSLFIKDNLTFMDLS
jgi:hypothetical protein